MIYLDSNATTPIDEEVFDAMEPYLKKEYGNPSSKYYMKAIKAKKAVEEAREKVAKLINAEPKEIIFTGGASESNNFILKGVMDYGKYITQQGNHLITSKVEHKSVLNTAKFLNGELYNNLPLGSNNNNVLKIDRGYEVDFLNVNEFGQIDIENFKSKIKKNTVLASIIWGNNEIGSLNDINELSKVAKQNDILFHSDATQVLGKINIDVKSLKTDFLSFSAHKLYGPKGIGACYMKASEYRMPKITALIHGGEQEKGYRGGTHAVHNIVGFGKAAEIAKRDMDEYIKKINDIENDIRKVLRKKHSDILFVGDEVNHIPGTIGFILPSEHNELFIKKVSEQIAISNGSACSINEPSYILKAIGKESEATHFFRMAISKYNQYSDIDYIVNYL